MIGVVFYSHLIVNYPGVSVMALRGLRPGLFQPPDPPSLTLLPLSFPDKRFSKERLISI